jgi:hypothetical protein
MTSPISPTTEPSDSPLQRTIDRLFAMMRKAGALAGGDQPARERTQVRVEAATTVDKSTMGSAPETST